MTNTQLDLTADIIDVRGIIERVEELENELEAQEGDTCDIDVMTERNALCAILDDLKGYGGDEQWRGDWYPVILIRDSHFTDYAHELCEDIGDVPRDLPSYIEIDWEQAARDLSMDYTSTEIDGVTYFYR